MQIKPIFTIRVLAGLAVVAGLAACANPRGDEAQVQHHMGQSANTSAQGSSSAYPAQGGVMGEAMTGSGDGHGMMGNNKATGPGGMQNMDKDVMCAMYRGMRDAPNEQARQAMMERQMQGMSPEMRQQHMEMMRRQCQ